MADKNAPKKSKKVCAISRKDFAAKAKKAMSVVIDGIPMAATYKDFSTGSMGYNLSGKMVVDVGGTPVEMQVGCNITVVGSKELPK